jgi:tetraacyldisaccharide 4'-kinase
VAVAERRVEGIEALMREDQKPDVILLDDAYQHRHVKPGLSILLVDYNRPLWNDMPFPGGRLREFARGARRADLVVFTKCPADVSAVAMDKMVSKVRGARPETTFFAGITYLSPRAVVSGNADSLLFCNNPSFVLLTGVASATGLVQYLREQGSLKKHFEFPDHYFFTPRDIEQVETYARNENLVIITTQKDAVRLLHMPLSAWMKEHLYYLPITTSFVDGREKEFVYQVYKYLANA